ncbi:NAD(P)/FAD-dependent oxidoreductase [Actinopolymorpha alba]|uniref:NAD(P)/FAD-dependent oxidoreductase n=1 Tax=Actinopolymorpha alba TaxID=533267 RepID=UPI00036473AC|nr:FAD-dependent oxidoreductase [Actinopolymorpha alba]
MQVVVIGSGIVGASAAYHLALREVSVVLVDRVDVGRATDAGAGIVCPWISSVRTDPATYQLHVAGACYYPELVARLADDGEPDPSYAPVGGLYVSADETELSQLHDLVAARRAQTPEIGTVTRLDPSEVRRLFPPLRADLGGVHLSGGGRVDGRSMRDALSRAAARHGVRQMTGSAQLVLVDGKVTGVHVSEGDVHGGDAEEPTDGAALDGTVIPADAVIVAAGAWAGELLRPAGVKLALAPQKGQIIHLELAGVDTSTWPIVQPAGSHYLLAFPGGRIVCGATRETGSGYDDRITAGGVRQVLSDALRVAPGLSDATLLETRVGFRPLSGDGIPFLGRVPEVDHLIVATGLGATGLTAGPYAGAIAAQLALDEAPPLDLSTFRLDRS